MASQHLATYILNLQRELYFVCHSSREQNSTQIWIFDVQHTKSVDN